MTYVLIRRGIFRHTHTHTDNAMWRRTDIQTQKGDGRVKTEAEIGVIVPQAKQHLGLWEVSRVKKGCSLKGFRGNMVWPTPWL